MSKVTFEDKSGEVADNIKELLRGYLEDSSRLIKYTATKNTGVDTTDTKGAWNVLIDMSKLEAQIGNSKQNAIWEEYGTGEYALEGNGRKGGWLIPEYKLEPRVIKKYRFKKVILKGEVFYFTLGKKPKRMLYKAFTAHKKEIKQRAQTIMKGIE